MATAARPLIATPRAKHNRRPDWLCADERTPNSQMIGSKALGLRSWLSGRRSGGGLYGGRGICRRFTGRCCGRGRGGRTGLAGWETSSPAQPLRGHAERPCIWRGGDRVDIGEARNSVIGL